MKPELPQVGDLVFNDKCDPDDEDIEVYEVLHLRHHPGRWPLGRKQPDVEMMVLVHRLTQMEGMGGYHVPMPFLAMIPRDHSGWRRLSVDERLFVDGVVAKLDAEHTCEPIMLDGLHMRLGEGNGVWDGINSVALP